jgi:DNA repair protein RadC
MEQISRVQQEVAYPDYEDYIVASALAILSKRLKKSTPITDPAVMRQYLAVLLAEREHEVFGLVFLDYQSRVIAVKEMFRGSLNHSSVYPREVIKEALSFNAGFVILFHNHPGGLPTPSKGDLDLTKGLADALKLVDIVVSDHIIVCGHKTYSFKEQGKLG